MLTIDELLKATGGYLSQSGTRNRVTDICIDSRMIKRGCAFVAVIGEQHDGHKFIASAVVHGASTVIVSRETKPPKNTNVILVKNTTVALGKIAAYYRKKFSIPVVAITGSAGKTSCKERIARVCGQKLKLLKNERSFNNHIGVPLTLLKLRPRHQAAILELGTNRPGDIPYLAQIVQPDICVFTNVGESHLEQLKTPAGVYKEKTSMIRYMDPKGTIIYNADDRYLRKLKNRALKKKKLTFGFEPRAFVRAILDGPEYRIRVKRSKRGFKLKSTAVHEAYNAMAAVAVAKVLKIGTSSVAQGLRSRIRVTGRSDIKKAGGITVIDDTYNSNPVSFKAALDTLKNMTTRGRKIFVCGDMLELGKRSRQLHEQCGKRAVDAGADGLLGVGKYSRFLIEEARKSSDNECIRHFTTRGDLHKFLGRLVRKGDVILVKGSRSMQMEKTVDFLLRKVYA